jgi:hypothetical protein
MTTKLCIDARRGEDTRRARVEIKSEPATAADLRAAVELLGDAADRSAKPWMIDAIYYESQEAF